MVGLIAVQDGHGWSGRNATDPATPTEHADKEQSFPLCITRLSGLPATTADSLQSEALSAALKEVIATAKAAQIASSAASEALFADIGVLPPGRQRSHLLRLRREVFGGRRPRREEMTTLAQAGGPSSVEAVTHALVLQAEAASKRELLNHEYLAAVGLTRDYVRRAVLLEPFAKGVSLSSPALFRNFRRYTSTVGPDLGSRDLQIERGILRYLTRAAMKATPFAQFCTVVEGSFEEADHAGNSKHSPVAVVTPGSERSLVRLNKMLLRALWTHLRKRPAVRRQALLELNPTLTGEDDGPLVFIGMEKGSEAFKRVDVTPSLSRIVEHCRTHNGSTYNTLCHGLTADDAIDASQSEVEAFLDALIRIGLIRLVNPVPAQESDWAGRLIKVLESLDDDHATVSRELLEKASAYASLFRSSTAANRAAQNEELRSTIDTAFEHMGIRKWPRDRLLLYEDYGQDSVVRWIGSDDMVRTVETLRRFANRLQALSSQRSDLAAMRHFFDNEFFPAERSVPVLRFFEVYYRKHYRQHLANVLESRGMPRQGQTYDSANPFGLVEVSKLTAMRGLWTEVVRRRWRESPGSVEIGVAESDLPSSEFVAPLNPSLPRSTSVFCQIVPSSSRSPHPRLVVPFGQLYSGYGKYFSRFLELVSDGFVNRVRQANERSYELIAEIAGDADFNANLHPQLTASVISYPTGDGEASFGDLRCVDLFVERDEYDPIALVLLDKASGRRVYPVDLGFLNTETRPALYQFLSAFSPPAAVNVVIPASLSEDASGVALQPGHVRYRPRIVYEERIVLSRRRWTLSHEGFPARLSGESDSDYFLRLNLWRVGHGIPRQVYVRLILPPDAASRSAQGDSPAPGAGEKDTIENQEDGDQAVDVPKEDANVTPRVRGQRRSARDYAKPQYVDFESPLLADLFARLPAALDEYVVLIEERYPDASELPCADGNPRTAECILQFDATVPTSPSQKTESVPWPR